MRIQARQVDVKRHTLGYKVSGKWRTRNQAHELARAGKIDGVGAYRRGRVKYIQSLPGHTNLYSLPEVIA
tara:strand:- start:7634 stop:7843 length:210 start_codon:yes stop_codon:yes gene_type:complete